MNIEGEIEFLKGRAERNSYFSISKDTAKEIIKNLDEGKKYKEIFEELEGITGATEWEMVDLKEIKEQYFPEPEPKKAMEVKEAIKINKIYKKLPLNIDEAKKIVDYISNSIMVIVNAACGDKFLCKDIDDIISLLQRGEKYRLMWEELYFNKIKWNNYSLTVYMQELIKKYFSEGGEKR